VNRLQEDGQRGWLKDYLRNNVHIHASARGHGTSTTLFLTQKFEFLERMGTQLSKHSANLEVMSHNVRLLEGVHREKLNQLIIVTDDIFEEVGPIYSTLQATGGVAFLRKLIDADVDRYFTRNSATATASTAVCAQRDAQHYRAALTPSWWRRQGRVGCLTRSELEEDMKYRLWLDSLDGMYDFAEKHNDQGGSVVFEEMLLSPSYPLRQVASPLSLVPPRV
jgi:hypothetical protein